MLSYDVLIECAKGENIEFLATTTGDNDGKSITDVSFKMNTLSDETRNRADDVRCEIIIKGNIFSANKAITKNLAKWSMDNNNDTLYRKVTINVYDGKDGTGDLLRIYIAENLFCIDYEECFGRVENSKDYTGTFRLFLAQKEGKNNIDVLSN